MSLLWGLRSGQWWFALITAAVSVLPLMLRQRMTAAPVNAELVRDRVLINGRRVTRNSRLWLPHWRAAVVQQLRQQPQQAVREGLHLEAAAREYVSNAGGFSVWFGVSGAQHLAVDLEGSGPHTFVVGPTGTGKSQFLRLLVQSLSAAHSRAELEIAVLDFKGGALIKTLEPSNLVLAADDLDAPGVETFCDWISAQLIMREQGFQNLAKVLVIVDEAGAAVRSNPRVSSVLVSLAARGRSLGMFLVIANQGLSGVPRELLLNLRMRVALAGTDTVELVQLGGQAQKLTITDKGWLKARLISQSGPDRDFEFPIMPSR